MLTFSNQMEKNQKLMLDYISSISRGLKITSSHCFNMRIIQLSWPWALLGLRHRIIFPISSTENVIVDKRLSAR